ncbi:MAG: nucleotidyl transferase AbiEii/AbiGii toxin family protein [Actinomycetota bacterium]
MIPQAFIAAWSRLVPWPTETQVEQDLILSRLIIDIADHQQLGAELAMRGGTCLHKLHLPAPVRYSEDLDYVRRTRSAIGPYMAALREVATTAGLTEQSYVQNWQMAHMVFDAEPTSGIGRIRIKIEINVREVDGFDERATRPYTVDSPWWSGNADIPTFSIEELMGTKLRALYQRRKGRDLFDLWLVLTTLEPDCSMIVKALRHYISTDIFGFADLAINLTGKLKNREFREDLDQLVVNVPEAYDIDAAADLVMERLGKYLDGTPPLSEIRAGAWRR